MSKFLFVALMSLTLAVPAFGKTHDDPFPVPCGELWPAVKDTLRNSGKYRVMQIDNNEMSASFVIGGALDRKRINSMVLNAQGTTCVMQIQTSFSGVNHNDAGAFKKRVEQSLAKLKASKPAEPAKPEDAAK